MKKNIVLGLLSVAGLAGQALAQQAVAAPTSAQRVETRFMIERFAPDGVTLLSTNFASNLAHLATPITYDTNVAVGRVDITYQGRVGILPNSAGTDNLGISRLGGAGSATTGGRIFFVDAVSQAGGLNQGTVSLAVSSGNATGAVPARGLYGPFRGTLLGWSPTAGGSNTDTNNGVVSNTATGSPVVYNFTGGRTTNFGNTTENYGANTDGFNGSGGIAGAATIDGTTLAGDFASYYKISYTPRQDFSANPARLINAQAQGQSLRYIFKYNGGGSASNGASVNLANTLINFAVPTPGAAALMGLGGLTMLRRRR